MQAYESGNSKCTARLTTDLSKNPASSMKVSDFWKHNISSLTQKIRRILRIPKNHSYRFFQQPVICPILKQINPLQ
jgi:hypothetical protein